MVLRFAVADVFWAMAWVAVSLAGCCAVFADMNSSANMPGLYTVMFFGSGIALGGAIGALFQRKRVGALIAAALFFLPALIVFLAFVSVGV